MRLPLGIAALLLAVSFAVAPLARAQDPKPASGQFSARVKGLMVDEAGQPLAGVRLTHHFYPGAELQSTTGADGRFDATIAWSSEEPATWYALEGRNFGYSLCTAVSEEGLRPDQVFDLGRLTLKPGGAVTGQITRENTSPLAEAYVCLVRAEDESEQPLLRAEVPPSFEVRIDSGSCDDSGTFDVVGLPVGRYVLWAKHETTFWAATASFEVRVRERTHVRPLRLIGLPPSWCIEGTVVDPLGNPVDDATVSSDVRGVTTPETRMGFYEEFTAKTDRQGHFKLYLPYMCDDPLNVSATVAGGRFDDVEVSGIKAGTVDVRIQLGGMREIEIFVSDPSGKPIEFYGWSVQDRPAESSRSEGESPTQHPGGRARIRVPVGDVAIEIRSDPYKRQPPTPVSARETGSPIAIILQPTDSVTGQVLFEGRPVAGAAVELVQRDYNTLGDEVFPGYWNGLYKGLKEDSPLVADDQGFFTLPSDFPHIEYFAHAWAPGFAEGFAGPTRVGGKPVVVQLAKGSSIEGSILIPGGVPSTGIEVEAYRFPSDLTDLYSELGRTFRATVDGQGAWKVDSLASGPWLIRLRLAGTIAANAGLDADRVKRCFECPWQVQAVSAATTHFDIDLGVDDLCRLDGQLAIGDFIPSGRAELLLEPPIAACVASTHLDDSGRFTLVTRQPGRYRLAIHADADHYRRKVITDVVDVQIGQTNWVRNLPPSAWAGKGIRLDKP
jgi:hypothetical protein